MVAVLLAMPSPSMVATTLASPWDRKKTAEGVLQMGVAQEGELQLAVVNGQF